MKDFELYEDKSMYEVVKKLDNENEQSLGDFATFDEAYMLAIKNKDSYIVKITPINDEYDYETVWVY